jgi:hypothetical protein
MPCSVLRIVDPRRGFGVGSSSRILHGIGRTGERPINESSQEVASKDREDLCSPEKIVVGRKADGDQRGEVERPRA